MIHLDIQGRSIKSIEGHRTLSRERMVLEDRPEQLRGAIDAVSRGVVGQAVVQDGAYKGTRSHVGDRVVAHGFVGDSDQEPISTAYLGGPKPHRLHHTIDIGTHLDAVPDFEGFVDEHRDRTEQVGHRILRRQTKGQSQHRDRT